MLASGLTLVSYADGIAVVNPAGVLVDPGAPGASIVNPASLDDGTEVLVIPDAIAGTVVLVNAQLDEVAVFDGLEAPVSVDVGPDGATYVCELAGNRLTVFAPGSSEGVAVAEIDRPTVVVVAVDGTTAIVGSDTAPPSVVDLTTGEVTPATPQELEQAIADRSNQPPRQIVPPGSADAPPDTAPPSQDTVPSTMVEEQIAAPVTTSAPPPAAAADDESDDGIPGLAIVAVLVILAILVLLWFLFLGPGKKRSSQEQQYEYDSTSSEGRDIDPEDDADHPSARYDGYDRAVGGLTKDPCKAPCDQADAAEKDAAAKKAAADAAAQAAADAAANASAKADAAKAADDASKAADKAAADAQNPPDHGDDYAESGDRKYSDQDNDLVNAERARIDGLVASGAMSFVEGQDQKATLSDPEKWKELREREAELWEIHKAEAEKKAEEAKEAKDKADKEAKDAQKAADDAKTKAVDAKEAADDAQAEADRLRELCNKCKKEEAEKKAAAEKEAADHAAAVAAAQGAVSKAEAALAAAEKTRLEEAALLAKAWHVLGLIGWLRHKKVSEKDQGLIAQWFGFMAGLGAGAPKVGAPPGFAEALGAVQAAYGLVGIRESQLTPGTAAYKPSLLIDWMLKHGHAANKAEAEKIIKVMETIMPDPKGKMDELTGRLDAGVSTAEAGVKTAKGNLGALMD